MRATKAVLRDKPAIADLAVQCVKDGDGGLGQPALTAKPLHMQPLDRHSVLPIRDRRSQHSLDDSAREVPVHPVGHLPLALF